MDFLGNPQSSGGVSPEQEQKLDAINVEPSGEVKFDNGIIVNGGATELKTTITEVDDPILQINRANASTISGITVKNADDGKYNSILRQGTSYWFTKDTLADDTLAPSANERANIICGNVNSVNVGQLNGDYNLHVADTSIHTPLNDGLQTNTNIWSASKIASEITAGAGAVIDDITPAVDKVYSSSKTQNIVNTVQNNLTTHTSNADIHRQMADGLTSTTTLWSSQKTANEIGTVNTALGLHTTNNTIHAELNDGLQTNTNLWSADKIQAEIGFRIQDGLTSTTLTWSSQKISDEFDAVDLSITNLETSATRALIQDSTGETKIELSQPQLSLTSAETKIKAYDVIPGTVQYEWEPATNFNCILSNSNTRATCPAVAGLAEARVRNSDAFVVGNETKEYIMSFENCSGNYTLAGIVLSSHPVVNGVTSRNVNRWWLFRNGPNAFTAVGCPPSDLGGSNVNNADGDRFKFTVDLLGNVTVEKIAPFPIGNWDYNGGAPFTYPTQLSIGQEYRFFVADEDPNNVNPIETGAVQLQPVPTAVPVLTPVDVITVGNNLVDVTGDLKISGDLLVSGSTTTVNTDNITIEDPLIKLANNNITNVTNLGFIGQYNDGVQKYSGLMQTYNNSNWILLGGTTQVPSESVLNSYNLAELGILNLNQAVLSQVLPYFPASGIRLINGTEEIKVSQNSIDFTDTAFNVNSVQQDTKVSAFGQYYVNYSPTSPLALNLNSGYDSAFAIPAPNTSGQNVGYASPTNTFTILHAGWYRISYILSLKNLDDDSTFIRVTLRKNGGVNDSFEKQSVSRHLRMKNRANTLTSTFIHSMALNDTIRLHIEATEDNGNPGNEDIHVYDVNVNIERMRNNL